MIEDALKRRRKNETFERALGKAVRRSGGKYEDYIEIMSHIRDKREEKSLTLEEAARDVASVHQL
ncbi:MAG: hypothetical protein LN417_10230 [Candidatus Thermoplasmatota archaeon]|nr:hypothetical protein [Candidatus Thermoplasmatota archaeon]